MKTMTASPVALLAAAVLLAACASAPMEIVSSTDKEVAVAIGAEGTENIGDALVDAGEMADRSCKKSDMMAKLNRTEDAADGVVAYFDCVAPPPPAKPAS